MKEKIQQILNNELYALVKFMNSMVSFFQVMLQGQVKSKLRTPVGFVVYISSTQLAILNCYKLNWLNTVISISVSSRP